MSDKKRKRVFVDFFFFFSAGWFFLYIVYICVSRWDCLSHNGKWAHPNEKLKNTKILLAYTIFIFYLSASFIILSTHFFFFFVVVSSNMLPRMMMDNILFLIHASIYLYVLYKRCGWRIFIAWIYSLALFCASLSLALGISVINTEYKYAGGCAGHN